MLKSIKTKNLYGRFNYNFDFSLHKMTIISGPNGFGKTTILNIVRSILDDDLLYLSKLPFSEIELKTYNDNVLTFIKNENGFFINGCKLYVPSSIVFGDQNRGNNTIFYLSQKDLADINITYKRFISAQQVLSIGAVDSEINGASTNDTLIRINVQLIGREKLSCIDDLLKFYIDVGNSIYCGADRLYYDYGINDGVSRKKERISDVIVMLSKKILNVFNDYIQKYTALSNSLDFSFISKLNAAINDSNKKVEYTNREFEEDKNSVQEKVDKLINYGFLIRDASYNQKLKYNKEYNLAFKIFYSNFKQKLDCLEDLIGKLDLFTDIVNSKLLNKKIKIIKSNIESEIITITDGERTIPLSNLSSGEKEIIVMYFKLIFEDANNLIALIDEPELSTHVSWQYEALDDFEKIMKANSRLKQIIVCTHSPQIVNNRWEEVIDLYDQNNSN